MTNPSGTQNEATERDKHTFTVTFPVRSSFVLNGKRYTVKHYDPMPAGTYRLVRTTLAGDTKG